MLANGLSPGRVPNAIEAADKAHYHIPRLGEIPFIDSTAGDSTAGFQDYQATGTASPGICDGLIDLNSAPAELAKTKRGPLTGA